VIRELLPFIVIGITSGAVYGLMAMGLVVTYVTSGVFNFGHGAIAMVGAYAFYSLREQVGLPTPVAFLLTMVVFAPALGLAFNRLLFRRLEGKSSATYIVASLGLLVGLQALAAAIYGGNTRYVAPLFPTGTFRVGGVNVGYDQAAVVAICVTLGLALQYFFRRTRLGVYTRAVVQDRNLTSLTAVSPNRITSLNWIIGSMMAALAGILISPFLRLDPLLLTLLVVDAFSAAVVARLRMVGVAMVAAFAIGVAQSIATHYAAKHPNMVGLPTAVSSLILFGVLVFSRKGSFAESTAKVRTTMRVAKVTRLPYRPLALIVATALLVPMFLKGGNLLTASMTLLYILIFASLSLVMGLSRQVSLAHAMFVVFGATTTAHLVKDGLPFGLAALVAALIMVPVGALVAIPSIRLSGLFLALATFAFGVVAQNLLFQTSLSFGVLGVIEVHRPSLFASDVHYYYLLAAVVIAGLVAIEAVRATRLGRVLRSLADSRKAVESLGVDALTSYVLVFCASAFLAALCGALVGALIGSVHQWSFPYFQSLIWVAVLVTAGAETLMGSVLAALLLITVPAVFPSEMVSKWQPVAFGFSAVLLSQRANGLAGLVRQVWTNGGAQLERLAAGRTWRLGHQRVHQRLARLEPATTTIGGNDALR
jgi:branched-subunit amino acid ABC-type transport system permease component